MTREFILLSVLTLFLSLTSFAQEDEYVIIDSLKNTVLEYGDIEVYPINEVEVGTVETGIRKIFRADSISIGKEITGRYVKEVGTLNENGASNFFVMNEDFHHFVKNELVQRDSIQKLAPFINRVASYAGGSSNYLIKNVETGKLYYTKGDILNNWGKDYKIVMLFSRIDKLNIKRQIIDEKIILHLNGFQCVLTADIVQAVYDGDASGIKTMNESVNKYKEYNKTASDIAVKLTNHIKQYKARLLKDDGLAAWKKDTKECDAILTKMRNLPYANSEYYNEQLDEDEIEAHTAIIDLVLYSKGKLGI
jgi:hypothetical protein